MSITIPRPQPVADDRGLGGAHARSEAIVVGGVTDNHGWKAR